ncbi:MAG: transporter substrate-binding domain-containing protein [Flavobacteriaceae bacterium]|nr:transporter substrate-binding domain-containing protein [Flavobacteriaceae bacterium]
MKIKITCVALFLSLTLLAQTETLKFAVDVWPPFANIESEKSIALDLVTEALMRSNIEVSHSILKTVNIENEILSKNYDGVSSIWKNKHRETIYIFSEPYLLNRLVLVGLKGASVDMTSVEGLSEKKIGLVKGFSYDDSLMNTKNADLIFSENDQDNLEKLFDKKIDYMLVDDLLIQYLLKHQLNDVNTYLSIGRQAFQTKTLHIAIRKDVPNANLIISKFNEAIQVMMKDGSYNKILDLNWVKADVDNDGIAELVFNGDAAGTMPPEQPYVVHYAKKRTSTKKNKDKNSKYYINGSMYTDWNDVPKKYKVNFKIPPSTASSGLKIKF